MIKSVAPDVRVWNGSAWVGEPPTDGQKVIIVDRPVFQVDPIRRKCLERLQVFRWHHDGRLDIVRDMLGPSLEELKVSGEVV